MCLLLTVGRDPSAHTAERTVHRGGYKALLFSSSFLFWIRDVPKEWLRPKGKDTQILEPESESAAGL